MSKKCTLCNKVIINNIHVLSCDCEGVFHEECLKNYLKLSKKCPECLNSHTNKHHERKVIYYIKYDTWDLYWRTFGWYATTLLCVSCFCNVM